MKNCKYEVAKIGVILKSNCKCQTTFTSDSSEVLIDIDVCAQNGAGQFIICAAGISLSSFFTSKGAELSSTMPALCCLIMVPLWSEMSQYLHSQPAHPENSLGSALPVQFLPAGITHLTAWQSPTNSKAVSIPAWGFFVGGGQLRLAYKKAEQGQSSSLCAVWAQKPALHQQAVDSISKQWFSRTYKNKWLHEAGMVVRLL